MIAAEKIVNVLGLTCRVHTLNELGASVANGLPKSVVRATVKRITADQVEARIISAHLVPPATLKRRTSTLSPQESERVERLARVYATALDVWGNDIDARKFLFAAHPLLDGRRPIDLAFSELGARQVEHMLASLMYGLPV